VILDSDLAKLYGASTKRLNEQVKRNADRFPEDFVFQLSPQENDDLRSQFTTSKQRGGRWFLPYSSIKQGIGMLSSVLFGMAHELPRFDN
jgi:hypothetical protein